MAWSIALYPWIYALPGHRVSFKSILRSSKSSDADLDRELRIGPMGFYGLHLTLWLYWMLCDTFPWQICFPELGISGHRSGSCPCLLPPISLLFKGIPTDRFILTKFPSINLNLGIRALELSSCEGECSNIDKSKDSNSLITAKHWEHDRAKRILFAASYTIMSTRESAHTQPIYNPYR